MRSASSLKKEKAWYLGWLSTSRVSFVIAISQMSMSSWSVLKCLDLTHASPAKQSGKKIKGGAWKCDTGQAAGPCTNLVCPCMPLRSTGLQNETVEHQTHAPWSPLELRPHIYLLSKSCPGTKTETLLHQGKHRLLASEDTPARADSWGDSTSYRGQLTWTSVQHSSVDTGEGFLKQEEPSRE